MSKRKTLTEMVEEAAAPTRTGGIVELHRELIERARATGYTWDEVAAGLSVEAGRRITTAALVNAWSRKYGGKSRRHRGRAQQSRPTPASPRPAPRHAPAPTLRADRKAGGDEHAEDLPFPVLDNTR